MRKIRIQIDGMTCTNCANGIKKNLENHKIKGVNVNFSAGEVSFDDQQEIPIENIKILIQKMGYTIIENKSEKKKISTIEIYFYISLIFTIPLFTHMFLDKTNILYNPIVQLSLCIPVYIIGVLHFGTSAWKSIKIYIPNMDVLIFIGSTSAFFYSIYGWILHYGTKEVNQYLFFETSATIITLVLLGNLLEHNSVKKTTSAISELSKIQQTNAKREINGKIEEVSFEKTKINDILIINNGDTVPTDGIVISGNCNVDESMITGESNSIEKIKGSELIGGTILIDGNVKIKVTKESKNTILSQIIRLVKDAQDNKPTIQKTGDKISSIFVPLVIMISIMTFLIGYYFFHIPMQDAILRSIAVLVISCPCAMGLATPTAVMVGIGRAAKNGILIKGGATLEKIASIKQIVFDKTGTLTTGNFTLDDIKILKGDKKEIKNIIYNLEKYSSHPIAKSLCKIFEHESYELEVSNTKEAKGLSISGKINNNNYTIGSKKLTEKNDEYDLYLLENKIVIAKLKISDQLKEGTKEVLQRIHQKNYNTILLSGDTKRKCSEVASKINIQKVYHEQSPIDKINVITELVNKQPTVMIGDGINDAPALEKSTVGISLSGANQIAIQSADVILLNKESIEQLPHVLEIGKHSLLTIKQNLFWAFSYNIIAIPLAIFGEINPMWAALFMAFSDIIVIGNSIRLRYKNIFY